MCENKYKGIGYTVKYCDPNKDWGDKRGLFYIDCPVHYSGYFTEYLGAECSAKKLIDGFVGSVPQNDNEWLEAFEDCMVWTGYEQCHLDRDMVLSLLEKAKIHYKVGEK